MRTALRSLQLRKFPDQFLNQSKRRRRWALLKFCWSQKFILCFTHWRNPYGQNYHLLDPLVTRIIANQYREEGSKVLWVKVRCAQQKNMDAHHASSISVYLSFFTSLLFWASTVFPTYWIPPYWIFQLIEYRSRPRTWFPAKIIKFKGCIQFDLLNTKSVDLFPIMHRTVSYLSRVTSTTT